LEKAEFLSVQKGFKEGEALVYFQKGVSLLAQNEKRAAKE
jgi:hypothetical protein